MSNQFIVHAEIVDPTPGRKSDNLIEPERDALTSGPDEALETEFEEGQVLDVVINTQGDRWKSVATINNVYEDEFGVLLGVSVAWGNATLVA